MSIIQSHDITLYGGNDIGIILRPLCDDHLPLLYKWNADPEVVYWSDTGNVEVFEEGIHSPIDIAGRIVPHKDYERLWRKRCMEMVIK
jgi:hypothetical protein